ncbi:MAG: hypothetical protein B6226_02210 [Candidatus Cloacimonetes bacterium 4572_65]|nr:MAG: hypothetical protein B6226_02210 [Candidatus Cloacimonetes bacterium 4572_65]
MADIKTNKRILVTDILGYIGSSFGSKLRNKSYEITGIVPVGCDPKKYADLVDTIKILPIAMTNIYSLKNHLNQNEYDIIVHIPKYHDRTSLSKKNFRVANVHASEQFVEYCLKNDSRLIYCSSTEVFGNTPNELPTNDHTEKVSDTYRAKCILEIELIIERNRLKGLRAVILRPSVIYGESSPGFSRIFIRSIKYRLIPNINNRIYIHFTNIKLLVNVLEKALTNEQCIGSNYNVADDEPLLIGEFIKYVSTVLQVKGYSSTKVRSLYAIKSIVSVLHFLKLFKYERNLELICNNWFFDIMPMREDFRVVRFKTLPAFSVAINSQYKKKKSVNEKS